MATKKAGGSKTVTLACEHTTLKIERIEIGQRCPDCRQWITRDGKAWESVAAASDYASYLAKRTLLQSKVEVIASEPQKAGTFSKPTLSEGFSAPDLPENERTEFKPQRNEPQSDTVNKVLSKRQEVRLATLADVARYSRPAGIDKGYTPSSYQAAVHGWQEFGNGNGIVRAVAGSGKTTLLVENSNFLGTQNAAFCAFNKHIAEPLAEKLGDRMTCKTIHSFGYGVLAKALKGRLRVDKWKYQDIIKGTINQLASQLRMAMSNKADQPKEWQLRNAVIDLLGMARLTLTSIDSYADMSDVVAHYGIDIPVWGDYESSLRTLLSIASNALKEGEVIAKRDKIIDYTDMVYYAVKWGLPTPKFEVLAIDECQDLNNMQGAFALSMVGRGGRVLAVGDPQQAIYGFAGADTNSFGNLKQRLEAQEFPLSVCYRCDADIVQVAKKIVPQIEAREGAPAGIVRHIKEPDLGKELRSGDMILCRVTAPLIKQCLTLIGQRIPARVRGKDIGKMLTAMVQAVAESFQGFTFEQFSKCLKIYYDIQVAKLRQRDNCESQIETLMDKVESLEVCYLASTAKTLKEFCEEIESLFSDDKSPITLSTIHKAKGLENPRVFILKPSKLPLQFPNQKAWEAEQEDNCYYIAVTRAQNELVWVDEVKG